MKQNRTRVATVPVWLSIPIAAFSIFIAMLIGAGAAYAQDGGTCVKDVTGLDTNCTAGDVELGILYNVSEVSCVAGETVTLTLRAELLAGSKERYDIGMFIANDGGDALTGSCYHYYLPPPLSAGGTCSDSGDDCHWDGDCETGESCVGGYDPGLPWPDPAGTIFFNGEPGDTLDTCGDIEQNVFTYYDLNGGTEISVPCIDTDGNGTLDIGTVVSWDNNKKGTCTGPAGAVPGTTSKCRADRTEVANITVEPGDIRVAKSADPDAMDEPGGVVEFTFVVENTSASEVDVTINSMVDDPLDDLTAYPGSTCELPQTLAFEEAYTCTLTAPVEGEPGTYTDTVTASGIDENSHPISGTATARVLIIDVPPTIVVTKTVDPTGVDEPGGEVDYTVRVANEGPEPVVLTSLLDDIYDDLDGLGDCLVDGTIASGAYYECSFSTSVSGDAGEAMTDTVTALAVDNELTPGEATDDAVVTILDVLPTITVSKTADPTHLDEPGGEVDFTVRVTNDSPEPVELTTLEDDIHGDLNGLGGCMLPQSLGVGGYYECVFGASVFGNGGDVITDTVSATAVDNEGNQAVGADDAAVTINDVLPSIDVDKTANPTSVPEPGGEVDFTVKVTNNSVEPVMLTALVDTVHSDLDGKGSCEVPQTIAAGLFYQCQFSAVVSGNAGDSEANTVTATAEDDEGNQVQDQDGALVSITNVMPVIDVAKTASPTSVGEPGGPVTFTVRVDNYSVEPVTLTSLDDTIHGDLSGQGTCSVPQSIAIAGHYECAFTAMVSGNAGDSEADTVTATAEDDEGNQAEADDDASVSITDELPSIVVEKVANPINLSEPGGTVAFTVTVTNNSVEAVTLTSLVDDIHGDLDGQGTCSDEASIAAGQSYTCSYSGDVSGNAGHIETDVVTAIAVDDELNEASGEDDATVSIGDVGPLIDVDKTADPTTVTEPGGAVTFSVKVTNNSVEPVTLTVLTDTVHGDLAGVGDCSLPQPIAVGLFYECSFSAPVSGNAGDSETDIVHATAVDDEENPARADDDATVDVVDVLPSIAVTKVAHPTSLPEPGGTVVFTVTVANNSVEEISLTSLVDSVHGDLNSQGDCVVPQTIAVAGSYHCSFSAEVTGNAGYSETDRVTADAEDDEGNQVQDDDDAIVHISDVLPSIEVTKDANPTHLSEPGGTVAFTVTVTNSSVETITLTLLDDSIHGNLNGQGTCSLEQSLAPGQPYRCSFEATVSGSAGDEENDVVTAVGEDDEGNEANAEDDATVMFEDVLPTIGVVKTAEPTTVQEGGAKVDFTVRVTNDSVEPVTLLTLVDDIHGDLDGLGNCTLPQSIDPDEYYECHFKAKVSGSAGEIVTDTVTATAQDNEENQVVAQDSASVTVVWKPPPAGVDLPVPMVIGGFATMGLTLLGAGAWVRRRTLMSG